MKTRPQSHGSWGDVENMIGSGRRAHFEPEGREFNLSGRAIFQVTKTLFLHFIATDAVKFRNTSNVKKVQFAWRVAWLSGAPECKCVFSGQKFTVLNVLLAFATILQRDLLTLFNSILWIRSAVPLTAVR